VKTADAEVVVGFELVVFVLLLDVLVERPRPRQLAMLKKISILP
jgi:hypothetical protein